MGCDRPTLLAAGKGFASHHCRYHVQHKARHGSHWHTSYRATELKPFIWAASRWLKADLAPLEVSAALSELDWTLAFAGRIDPAMNLRGRSAAYRAKVAFARLREVGVTPERLLTIYLAVTALIEDDRGSHRVREFRIVQAAKVAHRLASGTHRRWEIPRPDGSSGVLELHKYPRSSGLVLRKIGEVLERAGEPVAQLARPEIMRLKAERFGPHPSHLPGWRPSWQTVPNAFGGKTSD